VEDCSFGHHEIDESLDEQPDDVYVDALSDQTDSMLCDDESSVLVEEDEEEEEDSFPDDDGFDTSDLISSAPTFKAGCCVNKQSKSYSINPTQCSQQQMQKECKHPLSVQSIERQMIMILDMEREKNDKFACCSSTYPIEEDTTHHYGSDHDDDSCSHSDSFYSDDDSQYSDDECDEEDCGHVTHHCTSCAVRYSTDGDEVEWHSDLLSVQRGDLHYTETPSPVPPHFMV